MKAAAAWRWLAIGALALTVPAYCGGKRAGVRDARFGQIEREKAENATAIAAADRRRAATSRSAARAMHEARSARAIHREAALRVEIFSDSQVRIDGQLPVNIPLPAVSLLRAGDRRATADSLALVELQADVEACGAQNALYLERIALLERQLALMQPPKCGARCGAAVATTVILSLLAAPARRRLAAQHQEQRSVGGLERRVHQLNGRVWDTHAVRAGRDDHVIVLCVHEFTAFHPALVLIQPQKPHRHDPIGPELV